MSFMDKLKFWKRDEGYEDFNEDMGADFGGRESGFEQSPRMDRDMGMGLERDRTAGLAGTPDIGGSSPEPMHPGMNNMAFGESDEVRGQPNIGTPVMPARQMIANPPNMPEATATAREIYAKDMEIISSKLELLKVSIESVNQRLNHIEGLLREKRW